MTRAAADTDIARIVQIEQICFGRSAWGESLITDEVRSDRHIVLVADDLTAYGAISLAADFADLDRIAVLPAARGRGLARELLAALVDSARDLGADRMLLEVAADNAAAIGLYDSFGFDTINTRTGYYSGGIDALVMELGIAEWR